MLHWLRSAPSRKETFFLELLSFVTILHFVILLVALLYSNKKEHQHITLYTPIKDATAIVFVPLHKHITQQPVVHNASSDQGAQAPKKMISYDEYQDHVSKKKNEKKKSAPSKKKNDPKAEEKKAVQKTVEAKKEIPQKQVVEKIVPAKTVEKKSVKTAKPATFLVTKKQQKKKKSAPQKKDTKKTSEQKKGSKPVDEKAIAEKKVDEVAQPEQKIEEKKIETQPEDKVEAVEEKIKIEEPVAENVVEHIAPVEQVVQEQTTSDVGAVETETLDIDLTNVMFVGTQDLDTLHIQQAITNSILQYWKPPVGLSKNKTCQVTITLSATGNIENSIVSKSSGTPSFDICARGAVVKAVYPKEVWNKKITITLG